MRALLSIVLLLLLIGGVGGCASPGQLSADYASAVKKAGPSARTTVLFLLDGLSVPVARSLLANGDLPNIASYFLPRADSFAQGRAVFPTLTYPNITSILTSRDIDAHPIIGNQIFNRGDVLDFESPLSRSDLNRLIDPLTIFSFFKSQHRSSLAVAPIFGSGATAYFPPDVDLGVAYQQSNFRYVDGKLIDSLEKVLYHVAASEWPEFIFIHLVGIDALSHQHGRSAPEVVAHARFLDSRLERVFAKLSAAEVAGRTVSAILTSDHGMVDIHHWLDAQKLADEVSDDAVVLSEGRFVGFMLPGHRLTAKQKLALTKIAREPGVDAVVERAGAGLNVYAAGQVYSMEYRDSACGDQTFAVSVQGSEFECAEQNRALDFLYPNFAENVATYFHARTAPDFIVLAGPGYSFDATFRGDHGGLTPDEFWVPVLTHKFELPRGWGALRTYKLLQSLRVTP